MQSFNFSDWAEAYLNGKLSASERLQFETELFRNESLRDELAFQQDLIEGLQQTRHAELKARLESLPVPGQGVMGTFGGSTLLKTAASILGVGLVAGGLFYFLNNQPTEPDIRPIDLSSQQLSTKLPEKPETALTLPITAEEGAATETTSGKAKQASEAATENALATTEPLATAETKASAEKALTEAPKAKELKPEINRPDIVTFDSSEESLPEYDKAISPENPLRSLNKSKSVPLEVSAQQHEWYNFHYRFQDNHLFLYGDFGTEPYEILEISGAEGSRYFLYHNKRYYSLSPDRKKFTKLKPISDTEIVRELEINRQLKN